MFSVSLTLLPHVPRRLAHTQWPAAALIIVEQQNEHKSSGLPNLWSNTNHSINAAYGSKLLLYAETVAGHGDML